MKRMLMFAIVVFSGSVFANQGTEKENSKRDTPSSNTYESQMPTEKSGKGVKKGKKSTQSKERPDLDRGVNTGTPAAGGGMNNDMDKNKRSENE